MENIQEKADFLKNEFTKKLAAIAPATPGLWGKMNVPQMIEHMTEYVRIGSGKDLHTCVTPEDVLPKMQIFLATEKPFRENTPNSLLPDMPLPARHIDTKAAIAELQTEIDYFFQIFSEQPDKKVTNPFFGDLDYEMSVQLLHKHALHHLRQFNAA